MHRILFVCLLLFPLFSLGQITPRENASLNYRLVPFSCSSPDSGLVEIAIGRFEHMDSFEKQISISKQISNGQVIIEVPAFGTEYTWRTSLDRKLKLHHFHTLPYGDADTSKAR